jgi:hypothetical protein
MWFGREVATFGESMFTCNVVTYLKSYMALYPIIFFIFIAVRMPPLIGHDLTPFPPYLLHISWQCSCS